MVAETRDGSLIVVGAGGFGRETIELVRALRAEGRPIDLLGICDDDPKLMGHSVLGVPVLGPIEAVHDHPGATVVVTIGSPADYGIRRRIVTRLELEPDRYATLIHPTAVIPGSADIGVGTVIHAHCVLTADVTVGSHVAMMPSVVLTHDDRISAYVTVGAGVRVAGGVTVGEGAYVGAGALLREHVTVGERALIGMGAIVTRSVPPDEVWVGSPARRIRDVDVPL